MFEKLKQLKDLKDQARELKNKLSGITVATTAMDDNVTVVMDGNQEIVGLSIEPSVLSPDHKERLEKELTRAINDAAKKAKVEMAKQLQQGNFKLPNLGGLA